MSSSVFSNYSVLLLPICSAVALLLCLAAQPIGRRMGLLDVPGGRKSHRKPTPLMGGLCLLIGFYPWVALWLWLNPAPAPGLLPALGCAAILTVLGMIDDRRHLSATFRLLFCLLLITATLWSTPNLILQKISWNLDGGSFVLGRSGLLLSVVSITALIQAANLADGKNGLLIGMSLAWLYFLATPLPDSLDTILLSLAAVLIVLLAFNLSGRLFLGDGGSYGLATLLGFLALLGSTAPVVPISSDQFALIFLLPAIDMVRLMVSRLARRQSPFAGDRDHLHHHLLAAFGWPGGLVVYLMMVVLPSFVASGAPRNTLVIIALTIAAYFAVIAYARHLGQRRTASG